MFRLKYAATAILLFVVVEAGIFMPSGLADFLKEEPEGAYEVVEFRPAAADREKVELLSLFDKMAWIRDGVQYVFPNKVQEAPLPPKLADGLRENLSPYFENGLINGNWKFQKIEARRGKMFSATGAQFCDVWSLSLILEQNGSTLVVGSLLDDETMDMLSIYFSAKTLYDTAPEEGLLTDGVYSLEKIAGIFFDQLGLSLDSPEIVTENGESRFTQVIRDDKNGDIPVTAEYFGLGLNIYIG